MNFNVMLILSGHSVLCTFVDLLHILIGAFHGVHGGVGGLGCMGRCACFGIGLVCHMGGFGLGGVGGVGHLVDGLVNTRLVGDLLRGVGRGMDARFGGVARFAGGVGGGSSGFFCFGLDATHD